MLFFIRLFTTQGIELSEKGAKEQHLHLHLVFHLLFSDKKYHVDKLKRFIRDFILAIPTIKKKNIVPEHIRSYFSYYFKEEIKDVRYGHQIKLDLIHKPTATFLLQIGYMLGDIGLPHFFTHAQPSNRTNLRILQILYATC